jgi:hypothetical protein
MKAVFESSYEELLILHQRKAHNAYVVEKDNNIAHTLAKFRIIQDAGCFVRI